MDLLIDPTTAISSNGSERCAPPSPLNTDLAHFLIGHSNRILMLRDVL